ncbi:MAG: phosphotransferase [Microbacteriaceae bacterium]
MARSHLTLAALATSAVAGLDVAGARSYSYGSQGDFDAALLTGRDGRELIIRVPTAQAAETEQSADLIALASLSAGIRARLPFSVPTYVGQAPLNGTRAVVYDFLPGAKVTLADIAAGEGLATSLGGAIAAVHSLPSGFIGETGLPVLTAAECHDSTAALIANAAATRMLPVTLRDRWERATDDGALWQFQPTVINGALSVDSFLVEQEHVVGVLGWAALRVGDPARDLHWLLGLRSDAAQSALDAYAAARRISTDKQFSQRAMLYAELEIARWLLHGREVHQQAIVDDAVQMLDGLVDRVRSEGSTRLAPETGPIMQVADVEAMLKQTPGDRPGSAQDGHSNGLKPVTEDPAGEEFATDDHTPINSSSE